MEITSGGKRVFYSGDLRAHGRKHKLFDALISDPPRNIDLMLMEWSSLGSLSDDETFPTEKVLEETFVARFEQTEGIALVACSAQNIDRVVTIYRAAKRTGRNLIIDAYAAEVLKATGRDSIPQPAPGWSNLAVYIPQRQRVQLKAKGIAALVDGYRGFRIWPEQLAGSAPRSVMLFRRWMISDLDRANALTGARVFWSQWDGYLADGQAGAALKTDCDHRGIPFETIHTSGHAGPSDLQRLAIHYKYLVKPDLEKKDPYVSFDGKAFDLNPAAIVNTEYESKLTLPQLIKTAERFAGPEKSGVHKIARKEPKVVDLEIAFTKAGENGDLSAPRMDIAVLVQAKPGKAELVFCEAKCADNPELWGLEKLPKGAKSLPPLERLTAVIAQVRK